MLIDGIDGLDGRRARIVVVGSGPVGLALAVDLARRNIPVLLLESGGRTEDPHVQSLSEAQIVDPGRHDAMDVAVARRLGGSSNLWGGRCVPYDPIDFADRDFVDARWPIDYAEIAPYFPRAVAATQSGAPVYCADTPLLPTADDAFSADTIERWVNIQAAHHVHDADIRTNPALEVRTHCTLVGTRIDAGGFVHAIDVAHSLTGERATVAVDELVIAGGGLETTRQLLLAQRAAPDLFGGADGPLGRHYMGHIIGEIADIMFSSKTVARAFNYHVDAHQSYVRRRIVPSFATQMQHRLLNCAFWPVVPPVADPRHRSAILSSVYLALSVKPVGRRLVAEAIRRRHIPDRPTTAATLRHLANVLTGIPSVVNFAAEFFRRRYDRSTRLPGFFVLNKADRYGLSFHSEQVPRSDSRVTLTQSDDRLGVPTLSIDLRFSAQDIESLIKTHDLLECWVNRNLIGTLEYRVAREERGDAILSQAAHGTHQIGLARMSSTRTTGIVDKDLRTFDVPNLSIASSAVLPTSGQANPTLTTIALALRLADRLAQGVTTRPSFTTAANI